MKTRSGFECLVYLLVYGFVQSVILTFIVRYMAEQFGYPIAFGWWKTLWILVLIDSAINIFLPNYMKTGKSAKQEFMERN